jgi:hypothetical protein
MTAGIALMVPYRLLCLIYAGLFAAAFRALKDVIIYSVRRIFGRW